MRITVVSLIAVAAGAAAPAVPPTRAEIVAALLVRVDTASGSRATADQVTADVAALDRLGARTASVADDPRPSRRSPFRGRVLGPAFQRGWIDPGDTAMLQQQFLGGQKSTLAVAATPSTLLTLDVIDPNNAAMCRGAVAHCSWYSIFTQRYTIKLHNAGAQRVRFYLVVD